MVLSRCCVHLSLTCVISAVISRLTTLNFMSKESDPFAENVTVLFLFRIWTRLLAAIIELPLVAIYFLILVFLCPLVPHLRSVASGWASSFAFNRRLSATVSLAVVYPELLCENLMDPGVRLEAPA